ncbi:MAG: peptidoglycan DD-metalloendopeptidase family protein [Arenicellales bacterium]
MQSRLDAEQAKRGETEKRIERLDREVAKAAAKAHGTAEKRADAEHEITRLEDKSKRLRQRLAAQKDRVARLAYSAYVMGRQSRLKLFLNQQDPSVINRMLGYHDYVLKARARAIHRINDWASEVASLAEQQAARRSRLQTLEIQYRSEQNALEARRDERKAALAAVNSRIASSRDELSRLKGNEAQLKQVLEQLQEYLANQKSRRVVDGAFRSMKGKLQLPVSAPISAHFGELRSTGVRWDGIMLRPPDGADVKAIFDGRVVFADWLRGFGLLLIIDHGDGFMSLYSHNESLYKQVGDWVTAGEVIATVGTSGGLEKPGLYFEIRHDGEPQDPLSWCRTA